VDDTATLKDDPTIPDSELLYRGVHVSHLKADNTVSSAAFKSRTNPHVSVDLSSLSTPEETHSRRPSDVGVIELATGTTRAFTPGVVRDPIEGNPAHALIIHDFSLSDGQWSQVARKLSKATVWAIPPGN